MNRRVYILVIFSLMSIAVYSADRTASVGVGATVEETVDFGLLDDFEDGEVSENNWEYSTGSYDGPDGFCSASIRYNKSKRGNV